MRDVTVGYAGGKSTYPTYRAIKDSTEAVRVTYDPRVLTYEDVLGYYFRELGSSAYSPPYSRQYRSAILVHNEEQRRIAMEFVKGFEQQGRKVHVDIEQATDFYRGEEYHQKYFAKNRGW